MPSKKSLFNILFLQNQLNRSDKFLRLFFFLSHTMKSILKISCPAKVFLWQNWLWTLSNLTELHLFPFLFLSCCITWQRNCLIFKSQVNQCIKNLLWAFSQKCIYGMYCQQYTWNFATKMIWIFIIFLYLISRSIL